MTTIITRLYEDADTAEAVANRLVAIGFPESTIDVITQGGGKSALEAIIEARVEPKMAELYAQNLTSSRGLIVVRAPMMPMGAARTAMAVCDAEPTVEVALLTEEHYIRETPKRELFLSVLPSHRRFLTGLYEIRGSNAPRGFSAVLNIPMIVRRKRPPSDSLLTGKKFFSLSILNMPLLSPRRRSDSVIPGGRRIFG